MRARRARCCGARPRDARLIERLGIRYAIVDPTCTRADGTASEPPRVGRPVYVSTRLVVLRIGGG